MPCTCGPAGPCPSLVRQEEEVETLGEKEWQHRRHLEGEGYGKICTLGWPRMLIQHSPVHQRKHRGGGLDDGEGGGGLKDDVGGVADTVVLRRQAWTVRRQPRWRR
jgi:hypothetical protein